MVTTLLSRSGFLRVSSAWLLILFGMIGFADRIAAADATTTTNVTADADVKTMEAAVVSNQESLHSYLQLQEQIHNIQASMDKNRQETEAAAVHNAELLQARLDGIQKSLATQHLDELKDLEKSTHTFLQYAGAFLIFGFLVLLLAIFLQWNVANRFSSLAASLPDASILAQGRVAGELGMGQTEVLPDRALEQSTNRFLSLVERLEQRIQDMETVVQPRQQLIEGNSMIGENGANGETNGSTNGNGTAHELSTRNKPEVANPLIADKAGKINMLLGKGQTLLKLDKPEEALACFDEVLAIDPDNADALVKKGTAFERLQRLPEAVECYDHAIATDGSLTMAYLYKGGVFNRMQRYSEALECYEHALKTKDKSRIPDVIKS